VKLNARVEGLAALGARFFAVAEEASFAPDLQHAAEDIRRHAAANLADGAPPDNRTSALAKSLTVRPDGAGGYTVSTPLDHGWHLEFGSLARPAAPWLAPAAEEAQPSLLARIRARLNAAFRG
jgi:hypothetical protein